MATSTVTPMMAQYLEIKSAHPGALLFYRMGDFYEMFFEDAVAAAEALDIALTKRGQHNGKDIPMCGVPVHAAEAYLLTLIRKGFRVAVCEQLEDPAEARKRGAKSVVKRGVVRLVTPGTLTEDSLLDARRHNYLAAYAQVRGTGALAWVDISTGELLVADCPLVRLGPDLARLEPRELLVADSVVETVAPLADESGAAVTGLDDVTFDSQGAQGRLCSALGVTSLDGFGSFDRSELAALGALVAYLDLTQQGKQALLQAPRRETPNEVMQIDAATRRHLELTASLTGDRDGTVLSAIDRTLTPAGARLLERRIAAPSRDLAAITRRLDAVTHFVERGPEAETLRTALRGCPDMDRALSRLAVDRGSPRDLGAIRNALSVALDIAAQIDIATAPSLVGEQAQDLVGHADLIELLDAALVAEPSATTKDGGFVAAGFDAELDETRQMRDTGRGVIAGLQKTYAEETGIDSLKIKHNNVLGYFIETTATHAERMLTLKDRFLHRQTTANALRFTTTDLSGLETKILNASARAQEIEQAIFARLRAAILEQTSAVVATARALAELDMMSALADLARGEDWCRPVVEDSLAFEVSRGRHPVVERAMRRAGADPFVANDCALSAEAGGAIQLITGPNMAGKSTYLRQNALIALLAQAGSWVPARSARIGLVSALFSRVGAADDLARGRSTFMVEMVETAAILNQADPQAFVILDEIGRGTATYDGLSIAWATLEHLHDVNGCRALFATHYHELNALTSRLARLRAMTVAVKEWEGDVIFLHEVRPGAADRSYGVQVAKLAGLPDSVVARAKTVLAALEKGAREGARARQAAVIDDLPLFAAVPPEEPKVSPAEDAVLSRLRKAEPDSLSAREALDLIYELTSTLRRH